MLRVSVFLSLLVSAQLVSAQYEPMFFTDTACSEFGTSCPGLGEHSCCDVSGASLLATSATYHYSSSFLDTSSPNTAVVYQIMDWAQSPWRGCGGILTETTHNSCYFGNNAFNPVEITGAMWFYPSAKRDGRGAYAPRNCTMPSSKFVIENGITYFIDLANQTKSVAFDYAMDEGGLKCLREYAKHNYDRTRNLSGLIVETD